MAIALPRAGDMPLFETMDKPLDSEPVVSVKVENPISEKSRVTFIYWKDVHHGPDIIHIAKSDAEKIFQRHGLTVLSHQCVVFYGNVAEQKVWIEIENKPNMTPYEFMLSLGRENRNELRALARYHPDLRDALEMLKLMDSINEDSEEVQTIREHLAHL